MALGRNSANPGITGRFDNTITRYRNKKYVVYKRPENINFSRSVPAVTARNKFASSVKLARCINTNNELKNIWKYSTLKGTNAYQKLIKYNFSKVSPSGLSLNNIITPPGYFLYNSQFIFDPDELSLKSMIELPKGIEPVSFFILLSLSGEAENELLLLQSSYISLDASGLILGTINPSEEEKLVIGKFTNLIAYAAFTFTKKRLRDVCSSSTLSFQLSLS